MDRTGHSRNLAGRVKVAQADETRSRVERLLRGETVEKGILGFGARQDYSPGRQVRTCFFGDRRAQSIVLNFRVLARADVSFSTVSGISGSGFGLRGGEKQTLPMNLPRQGPEPEGRRRAKARLRAQHESPAAQ